MPSSLPLLVALLFGAAASPLEAGIDLYQTGEFARARAVLAPLIDDLDLALPQRAKALAYLAAARYGGEDVPGARADLKRLARDFPGFRLTTAEFHPNLVALADELRAEVAKEAQAAARPEPAAPPAGPPEAAAPADPPEAAPPPSPGGERAVLVRLGAFGFGEPLGQCDATTCLHFGAGASAGVAISGLDLSARLLVGANLGFGAEVAYRFLDGRLVQPRLSARFTGVPGAGAWGGGAAVGLQIAPIRQLWIGVEVGLEAYAVGPGWQPMALPFGLSLGAML